MTLKSRLECKKDARHSCMSSLVYGILPRKVLRQNCHMGIQHPSLSQSACLLVIAVRSKHVKSVHVHYHIYGPSLDVISNGLQSLQMEALIGQAKLVFAMCTLLWKFSFTWEYISRIGHSVFSGIMYYKLGQTH